MKRPIWLLLILGCILILILEAPAALSSVTDDLDEPYGQWEAPSDASPPPASVTDRDPPIAPRHE